MTPRDISTQLEFGDALRATVLAAIARDARSMLWCDPDFVAWPLDDPALLDPLATWLRRPMRRLVLLGGRYDRMERAHPRFTRWRDPWVHAIDTREPSDLAPDDGPTVLELWDRDIPRGRAGRDPAAAASARDRIDAALQRSVPAWPTKPLGL